MCGIVGVTGNDRSVSILIDGLKRLEYRGYDSAGIYVNECPKMAPEFVRVLVTDTDSEIHVYDYAHAYVLGRAKVTAHGHSQVYNFKQDADITLTDRSYGYIAAGKVTRLGFPTLNDKRK